MLYEPRLGGLAYRQTLGETVLRSTSVDNASDIAYREAVERRPAEVIGITKPPWKRWISRGRLIPLAPAD
jgi:hypothetical protein